MRKLQNGFLPSLMVLFSLFSSAFAAAQTTVTPASPVNFGNVVGGTTSSPVTITLKNAGAGSINLTSITLPAGSVFAFAAAPPPTKCVTPSALAASATCTITLTVTPTGPAIPLTKLTITSTASNSPQIVLLQATEISTTTLTPVSLNFGNVAIGNASAVNTVKLTNNGFVSMNITSLSLGAGSPYAINGASTTCPNPGALGAGLSCNIGLTLTPAALGAQPGTLSITDNAANSPQTVPLSGTGVVQVAVAPGSLNFGNVAAGTTSATQTVTVTNNKTTSLTVTSLNVPPGSPYSIRPSSTCFNPTVAAGASCTVVLSFSPTAVGAAAPASLTITDNASNSPQTVPLSGTGIVPVTALPGSLNLGKVDVGTTSAPQTVTVTNNKSTSLTISVLAVPGASPYSISSSSTCLNPTVAAGASCTVILSFSPTSAGVAAAASLTITDNAANSPQTVPLSGTGTGTVTASPGSLNFGSVVVGASSAPQTVTLTNNLATSINISSVSPTAGSPYGLGASTCGATLAAFTSCTVQVSFSPTAAGAAAAASLTFTDNAPNSPQTVSLSGTGLGTVLVSPTSLNFVPAVIGEASVQTVTLTNNLPTALTINSIAGFTGGYSLSAPNTTCPLAPATLPSGQSCQIGVSLTPPSLGPQNGTMNISYNASGSPTAVSLTANAVQPVVLSSSSLTFPAQFVGTTSAGQSVTLTNEQAVPLTISSVTVAGADPNDFSTGGNCPTAPATLSPGQSCQINVFFTPTTSGTRTATVDINDNAPGSPQTITLTGSGNAPVTVLPGLINNFTAPVGSTSPFQTITVTNNQTTATLHITSFQFAGDFIQSATSCGGAAPFALAPGASCTVSVVFDPTIGGTRNGQIQVVDDVATSPQIVNLSGTGTNPLTVAPVSLSFSAQTVGTVSTAKLVTLFNNESQQESFTPTTSGDYTVNTNCTTGVIAAHSSCNLNVSFAPSSVTPSDRTGTLTITHSAAVGSPISVPLDGSAIATPPQAEVAVVSPGAGGAGTAVNVKITGNGWTHFSASSVITFVDTNDPNIANDITVSNQVLVNANEIDATLNIGNPAAPNNPVYGARNITVSTPLSGGGTEDASLNSAFIIADPTQSYEITSVTPAFSTQGSTLNVSLTAVGTHFLQGVTFANFGDGVTVNSLTITDETDAQANITISNTTPAGYRTITMVTGGEFAVSNLVNGNPMFYIGPNSATLVSISPNSEPQRFTGEVAITATGTHFLQSATQLSINGVIVGAVNVTSPTTATADIAVPSNAPLGPQNVTVSTGGEISTLPNAFTITGSTPALLSVSPSSGKQGQQNIDVIITGNAYTAFNACPGGVLLADFTGLITTNSVTVLSANQVDANITITQDANVGGLTARLTCGGAGQATIFPFSFTITPSSAQIVSVVPFNVPQGGQVTLAVTGLNTHWVQGTTTSAFYPEPVPTPSVDLINIGNATHANLNIAVPTDTPVGTYPFYMATGGEIVSASIHVYANTPTLSMNPSNGLTPNTASPTVFTVNFTGQFTHWTQAATVPVIAGEGVTLSNFTVVTPVTATATLTIASGAATGLRLVTFTTGGEIVTTYFNVTYTPIEIIDVEPYHAPQNATLNVELTGLNTHFTPNVSQVFFGPQITVNTVTVLDNTHLIANITTGYLLEGNQTETPPGSQNLYVNTGNEHVSASEDVEQVIGNFAVDAPLSPRIESVCLTGQLPNCVSTAPQGSGGLDVTITGFLTNWVSGFPAPGASEVILGAGITVANLQIVDATHATATISVSPTAPVGGNSVLMITGPEIDSGTTFSVSPSAAYITSVEPNFICPTNYNANIAGFNCAPGGAPTGVPIVGQLQTATLNILGLGTHWLQGETVMSFGGGVNVDQLTINSPTSATAQITVLSSSSVGFATLTSYTDGESASLQQAIDIEDESPILLAITPSSGEQAATVTIDVLGRATHFSQGVTQVTFNNPDLTLVPGSIVVKDNEDLSVGVTISPWAYVDYSYPCGHELIITTGSEQVNTGAIQDNFCVSQGAEQINSVSPRSSGQGTTLGVNIVGSATNFVAGETAVSFGDPNFQVGQITVTDSTHLTASVGISTAAQNGFKNITVATLGQVATGQYEFTVTPDVATLNEAIPDQAEQGAPLPSATGPLVVRLLGQYSHFSGQSTATFGAGITVDSVQYISPTEVDATITIDPLSYPGGRTVTVTTPGVSCANQPPANLNVTAVTYQGCTPGVPTGTGKEIVTANVFTIIQGPAIITGMSANGGPATGNEGQEIVANITGSGTHWAQNFTQFYIAGGGYDIAVHSVVINSPTSATVDMTISPTANAGPRSIFMTTNGESLSDAGAFVVTGGIPVVTTVSPGSATQGTAGLEVTITGNDYTQWDNTSTVSFGPGIAINNNACQVDDTSHIECVIIIDPNAQPGYRTVAVQTGSQVLTGNFLVTLSPSNPEYVPPVENPYIWYENPSSAIPGQTLTVTFGGMYTHWDPNPITGTQLTGFDSNVTINTFQVLSPTSAIANITVSPTATAATYDLTLTTNTATPQEVDHAGFSVVVAQPVLSVVDPGSAIQGAQNTTVNIIGQFTHFDATTTFTFGSPYITVNGPPTILGPTIATQSISIDQLAPTGGYAVVAHTPDAPSSNQITVGGAGFSVTPSLALILSISPNTARQGNTINNVHVTGQNTHWNGATTFQFGDGIAVSNVVVSDETDATMTLTVPALAYEGATGATAFTGGEVASITNGFVVQAGTPYLLSSGPGSLPQQSSAIFTILSQQTTWSNANPPLVSYGPGVVVTNVNVTTPTSLTAEGYVQPTTPVGYRNLTVSTGTQVLTLPNAFYVTYGPAVINSVMPDTAGQGATLNVVISGINTNWQQGVTQLSFPNVVFNSMTVVNATTIDANITVSDYAPAGQESLTATTGGEIANGTNLFTVTQTQAELLAVVVGSDRQGVTDTITITGAFTNFSTAGGCAPNCTTVSFGNGITVNSVNATSSTQLKVNITVQPTTATGYHNVTVTTGPQVLEINNAFDITTGPAAIVSLTPNSGAQGTTLNVAVVGDQTHFAQGVTTANFSGGATVNSLTVTDLLHATVNITIPNNTPLGQYNVYLTTGGEVAPILPGFTVTSGTPQISVVNPPTGTQGSTNINVQLTGLYTHWVNGTSVASFGAGITVNSFIVANPTSGTANITILPTAALGSRNVTVTTNAEVATITGGFTVLPGIPALLTVLPGTGQAGTSGLNVAITGQFTTFQQGFSSVSMGSGINVTNVTVSDTTHLTATIDIAPNATVGSRDVSVTTNGQTQTLSGGFGVTAGTPIITQINANYGNPGQTNLAVTIYGQYTNWVNGTTVADFGPNITVNTTVVSTPTQLVATITIPNGTPLGPVTVTTTTSSEVETVPAGFTVQAAVIPPPSLLSISPGINAGGVPINSIFTFVFSQPMNRTTITTSTVEMWLVSQNPTGNWVTVPGTIVVDAAGRTVTFTPNSLLAVNAQYYLLLTNGIKDATGNTFPQYGYQSFYTTDGVNVTSPTVVAANPPANSTDIGTNVNIQLEFSADMQQNTQTGVTLTTGGNPVTGTYSWNSYAYGNPYWGPGTILTFSPSSPLTANTLYTVTFTSAVTDTAGNPLVPGSFSFTTGSGPDTVYNNSGGDFTNYLTNVGTNFAPRMDYAKPINPIDINTGTLLLYNSDSGKYVQGTVTVAPNGLSATFTPQFALLPNTYYRLYQAGGYYDADANYMYGSNWYFTTGAGNDTLAPSVANVSPANNAPAVPLNTEVILQFSKPIDPNTVNNSTFSLTPSGGSAVTGAVSLASDMVTLYFVPAVSLQPGTVYNIGVSGYSDVLGNPGTPFNSSFTTAASPAPIMLSTGFNGSGNLITTNNTNDANWVYFPVAGTPAENTFGSPASGAAQPLQTVGPGDAGWYGGWVANGPNSDWITINPNSTTGNTYGLYYTTFNIAGSVPANQCLVGYMGVDDNGLLALNGTAIMSNISSFYSLTSLNIPVSSTLVTGQNVLSLGWGGTDNYEEAFRLQASIQTCGSSITGGLHLNSATPAYSASNVATNTSITLTFNNPLVPSSVNANTLPVMVGWNSNQELEGTYQVNGNQVIFTPDSPFPANTQIWVGACGGPIDLAGDSAGGCYTQLTYFNTNGTATPAGTPFQIIASTPSNGATNVGLRNPVSQTFNRSVDLNTINVSDYALFAGDAQNPSQQGSCTGYSHSQDDTTIQFNCYPLPASTPMTAFVSSGITDWQGNTINNFVDRFTTSQYDSNTNGTVVGTRPGGSASGISANEPITFFLNYPVVSSTAQNGIEVAENNAAVPGTVQVLDNGYTLVFTPSSPWSPGALIQWWTNTTLLDATYETPFGAVSGYFTVAGNTATLTPTIQVTSPPNGTNPAALNSVFDTQFNTPINPATITPVNFYLYDGNTGLKPPVTYSQPQPNVIRMVPTSNLSVNDTYYVFVKTGLQSTTSVPATATDWYVQTYSGATVDSTLPTVTSAVPFNGSSNVGVNVTPGVVFSKPIDPTTVTNSTFQILNGATPLAGNYWFNSNNTRVEFVPYDALPANTTLTMSINGVDDLVGNPVTYSSIFQTASGPDFNAPYVVWTSIPTNGSIPTNSTITVQFNESMDVTTFSSTSNLRIYDTLLGVNIPATLTWNADQSTAYLTPTSPLAAGRTYYFYANSGTDLAGNQLSGIEITFYAELGSASTAPTVINFNPLPGATGVGTNATIEAQFSAPIDPTTLGSVTLTTGGNPVTASPSTSAGNTVLQLSPSAPLAQNTIYTMQIAGVKDTAGNAVATVTNSFTTGPAYDLTAATAINSDPGNYNTVGTNVTPKIVFNKPLNPITVNNSTFRMYLSDTGQWIPLTVTESANGTEVTLTPQVPLQPNTEYHYQGCCGFQDQDGNNGNQIDLYFYTNSGTVSTGPTVTVSPANGATAIPLNAEVITSVSAPVDPTTVGQNAIQVFNGATPVPGTVTLVNVQQISFAPTSALSAGTTYTVHVNNFTDANGNAVVPYNGSFITGASASAGGFTFTGSNIVNGSTVTNYSQPIVLNFSQAIDPSTVNANTLQVMNTWNSNYGLAGNYAVSGNQVTFTPLNPYPQGTTIYVGECHGPTDILGDVFLNGSCYGQQLVYFNTPSGSPSDTSPLMVLSVNPDNGATNVRRDQSVSVTFNKAINPYTVFNNSNNALLFAGQGLQVRGSITMSADDRTLTFSSGTLYGDATYTIDLPAGGISDPSGNSLATTFTSTFNTVADPATGNGSVQSTNPGNNATGIPTNQLLTLYMNRQVNPSTLSGNLVVTVNGAVYAGTVSATADNYEVQYTPTTPFPNSATVQWFFSSVYDLSGNVFNGTSGYFYTAAPAPNPATAQPTIVAISPSCCNSLLAPTNTEIDIQYSQPIDPTTVTTANFYQNGPAPAVPYTVALAPGTNNVVRISPPPAGWDPSYYYTGFCVNGNVKGTNGVNAPSECWLDYFTTTAGPDTTPGTVSVGPPNGGTNVGTNAYIRFQFSKPADRTTVNSSNIQITTSGNPIPGSWSYSYSGTDLYGANFSPLNPLPPSSSISIVTNNLLDYAGNTFAPTSTSFTTAALPDYSTPTATLDFAYGVTGIATNASFTCHYSTAMDPSSVNTGNTYIYSYITSARIAFTYAWSSDLTAVTMTPTSPLPASSQFYYYCGGAIDLTGNGMNAIDAVFYTSNGPASVGPALVYANPPSGMTGVPLNTIGSIWNNTSLDLLFNEPVNAESMGNITFTPQGGIPEPIGVNPQDGDYIATVQLPWALTPNTTYTFDWTGITDLNGNPATGTTSSSFTTGSSLDWGNATTTGFIPANGATNVSVSVQPTMTFSKAMNPTFITPSQVYLRLHNTQVTVPATVSISASATAATPTTVTVIPSAPLQPSTLYDLLYYPNNWWLYDVAGNIDQNSYGVVSTFTTAATGVNGACGIANGGTFSTPPPTANFCSAGTVANLSNNSGSLTWSCNSQDTGTNASCSATIAPVQACYPQSSLPTIAGWWKADGDATDHSSNANNGTLENGATFGLGVVNNAFSLSGSNQYVLIGQPVPAALQVQNNITLQAWIYPTAYPANYAFIAGSQEDGVTAGATLFYSNDGETNAPPGHINFEIGDGTNWHDTVTESQVPLNQWTLVTATRTSGTATGQIYFNGVAQPVFSPDPTWNGTISYPAGDWFAIGQEVNENRPFNGLIDEVQVFNSVLNPGQITGIYNAGNAGVCP